MSACLPETCPAGQDICFIHAIFCHTGLPRSPVSRAWFSRSSGSAWLSLFTGEDVDDESGAGGNESSGSTGPLPVVMPFGALPRLLLVWLSTAALRTDTPDIFLGPSISGWLHHVGMAADGRRYLALHRQIQALARTRLTIGFQNVEFDGTLLSLPGLATPEPESSSPDGTDLAAGSSAGSAPPRHTRHPLHIRLSPAYIRTLTRHAVPLQWSAVRHLRGSALSLDVYFWLACRLCRLPKDPLFLSWEQLQAQFGTEYRTRDAVRLFRRELLRRLPDIVRAYPSARIQSVADGMVFFPSPPPVPSRRR